MRLLLFFPFILILSCSNQKITKDLEPLSLVILQDSAAIFYGALDSSTVVKTFYFDILEVNNLLLLEKKKYGADLAVVIKPTPSPDVMARALAVKNSSSLNNIKNSTLFYLTAAEKRYFNTESMEDLMSRMEDGFPYRKKENKTRINAVFIKINEDESISVKYDSKVSLDNYLQLKSNSINEIGRNLDSIATRHSIKLQESTIHLVGSGTTKYHVFKNLIEALKQRDLMNFDIITE